MAPDAAPRTRDPGSTLEKLVASALPVFAEAGYERATIDRIVAAAGYSKGAFYTHFRSKEEFFLFILEQRLQGNLTRVKTLCRLEGSASEWLVQVLSTLMDFSAENKGLRALSIEFMANGMRNPDIGRRITTMHQRWRELFAETLRGSREYREGRLAASPEAIASSMVAMVDGFILQIGMEADPLSKEKLMRTLRPLLETWIREEA